MRLFSLGIFVCSLLFVREIFFLPDGMLHVHTLDVGQGDSILVVSPSGKQIVVDGGPDLSLLSHLGTFMPFFDREIDLVVLTHPDADHITALPELLRRYTVHAILLTGAPHTSGRYEALLATLEESSTTVIRADPATDIDMGDGVVLDIVWPTHDYRGASNDQSVVVRLLYKEHSILLAGDIEAKAERAILASGADIRSTILKVPHHGSRTSSSTGFLLSVHPQLALVSAGRDNRFGHPHADIIERYHSLGIDIRSTQKEGTVSLVFE